MIEQFITDWRDQTKDFTEWIKRTKNKDLKQFLAVWYNFVEISISQIELDNIQLRFENEQLKQRIENIERTIRYNREMNKIKAKHLKELLK